MDVRWIFLVRGRKEAAHNALTSNPPIRLSCFPNGTRNPRAHTHSDKERGFIYQNTRNDNARAILIPRAY